MTRTPHPALDVKRAKDSVLHRQGELLCARADLGGFARAQTGPATPEIAAVIETLAERVAQAQQNWHAARATVRNLRAAQRRDAGR